MTNLSNLLCDTGSAPALSAQLAELRARNQEVLASIPVPTRKTESWKYSAKHLKLPDSFGPTTASDTAIATPYKLDCIEIVIEGTGKALLDADAINQQTDGLVTATAFSELSDAQFRLIEAAEHARENVDLPFARLNSAGYTDGLFLSLAKNAELTRPIKLVLKGAQSGTALPRVFVQLETGASMTLVEEVLNADSDDATLLSSVVDIKQEANSNLTYLRMNTGSREAKNIALTQIDLMRDARFSSFCLGLGTSLSRHDLRLRMLEPGAECDLNGVCVTKDKQHYDNHTCIEHIAAHCTSNENYRCIADDQSHIVFNGRIHIHPNAQKTLGEMSNKNLLLASGAEIDSKPELEIYADDVKCAHGTTIGQLNEKELYYLQTRGVTEAQARLMLTLGFVLEIVRSAPIEAIADYWENTLAEQLSYRP